MDNGRIVDGVIVNLASSAAEYGDGEPGIVSRVELVEVDLSRSTGGRVLEREFVTLMCSISAEEADSVVRRDSKEDRELLEETESTGECLWTISMTGRSSSKPW
jgi:hypothetical protein